MVRTKNNKSEQTVEASKIEEPTVTVLSDKNEVVDLDENSENNDETEMFSNIEKIELKCKDLQKDLREITSLIKAQKSFSRKGIKYAKANKSHKKKSKQNSNPAGFNQAKPVPTIIIKEFGPIVELKNKADGKMEQIDLREANLPRTKITALVYEYIKKNNLQDEENRRMIKPDAKLKRVFSLTKDEEAKFEFTTFQTFLTRVYPETENVKETPLAKTEVIKTTKEKKPKAKKVNVTSVKN